MVMRSAAVALLLVAAVLAAVGAPAARGRAEEEDDPPQLPPAQDPRLLRSLNCSAARMARRTVQWVRGVVLSQGTDDGAAEPVLAERYGFYHSAMNAGEVDALKQAVLDQEAEECAPQAQLAQCASVVAWEADVGTTGLLDFLEMAMASEVDEDSDGPPLQDRTLGFGWSPVASFVNAIVRQRPLQQGGSDARRVEAGGGAGAGFQIFCGEGHVVLTAGGGGGGGVEGDFSSLSDDGDDDGGLLSIRPPVKRKPFSFGGGAGGGVQFRLPRDDKNGQGASDIGSPGAGMWSNQWVSVGGGSGCGTCTHPDAACNATATGVLCGTRLDDDTLRLGSLQARTALVRRFRTALAQCFASGLPVIVDGGGGGGGGTAECCSVMSVGYGFSFHATLKSPQQRQQQQYTPAQSSKSVPASASASTWAAVPRSTSSSYVEVPDSSRSTVQHSTTSWNSSGKARARSQGSFDAVGDLLRTGAKSCPKGYGDWCCTCSHASMNAQQRVDAFTDRAKLLLACHKETNTCPKDPTFNWTREKQDICQQSAGMWNVLAFIHVPCCDETEETSTSEPDSTDRLARQQQSSSYTGTVWRNTSSVITELCVETETGQVAAASAAPGAAAGTFNTASDSTPLSGEHLQFWNQSVKDWANDVQLRRCSCEGIAAAEKQFTAALPAVLSYGMGGECDTQDVTGVSRDSIVGSEDTPASAADVLAFVAFLFVVVTLLGGMVLLVSRTNRRGGGRGGSGMTPLHHHQPSACPPEPHASWADATLSPMSVNPLSTHGTVHVPYVARLPR